MVRNTSVIISAIPGNWKPTSLWTPVYNVTSVPLKEALPRLGHRKIKNLKRFVFLRPVFFTLTLHIYGSSLYGLIKLISAGDLSDWKITYLNQEYKFIVLTIQTKLITLNIWQCYESVCSIKWERQDQVQRLFETIWRLPSKNWTNPTGC